MTRDELRTRIRTAVARYTRAIADDNGVPFSLVEELAGIAEHHAAGESTAALAARDVSRKRPAARQ